MPVMVGNIQLYIGPTQLGAPDDLPHAPKRAYPPTSPYHRIGPAVRPNRAHKKKGEV